MPNWTLLYFYLNLRLILFFLSLVKATYFFKDSLSSLQIPVNQVWPQLKSLHQLLKDTT